MTNSVEKGELPFTFSNQNPDTSMLFDCSEKKQLEAGVQLIPFGYVCDTKYDCKTYRDENLCLYTDNNYCASRLFCPASLWFNNARDTCLKKEQICDGVQDCLDSSDEENCIDCMETLTADGTCLPSLWFYNGSKPFQQRYVLTSRNSTEFGVKATCHNKTICFLDNEPGKPLTQCDKTNDLDSKLEGEPNSWAPRCVYLRGRISKQMFGCTDLSHLENCESFQCGVSFFKCDLSYCIPIYLVNDGNKDCPLGDDELDFILEDRQIITDDLVPCRKPGTYVHTVHVCDGRDQCANREDELLCHEKCPSGFTCLWGAAQVTNHSAVDFMQLFQSIDKRTAAIKASGLDLSKAYIPQSTTLPKLLELYLSNCNLNDKNLMQLLVSFKNSLYNTYLLDLSYNKINFNNFEKFSPFLRNLHYLNLSHTSVINVHVPIFFIPNIHTIDLSFTPLLSLRLAYSKDIALKYLNLSFTKLSQPDWFDHNITIDILDLKSSLISFNSKNSLFFQKMTITSEIHGDSYKLCCEKFRGPGIAAHQCYAPRDGISTCENLLSDLVKRSLIWGVSMLGTIGNAVTISYRLLYEKSIFKQGYRLFVTNLGFSDLLMSVYLMIIAGADVYHRDNYVLFDTEWRDSSFCKAAGFLATLSSESSTVFVLLITFDRYLIFRDPLKQVKFSPKVLKLILAVVWTLSSSISLIPLIFPDWQVFSSSSVCLGLPINLKHELGRMFSLTLYIIVNTLLILLIIIGQCVIFKSIYSSNSMINTSVQRKREITVAQNLSLIVLSNILCWLPICVVGLMAFAGQTFSPDTHGWLAIIALPLNSAVNPIAYTLPIAYEKFQAWKQDIKLE
ncbi:G-protein coupled receptor GRL101-like [Physella acuta]|uniref:G-protein coupled receptor GRL101-like n=1 Tax=Physella acuta TaxID=109671 RepID=UPI0027DE3F00|nr:G-protein coupled receptor GRL101-like [Physella acuta]